MRSIMFLYISLYHISSIVEKQQMSLVGDGIMNDFLFLSIIFYVF